MPHAAARAHRGSFKSGSGFRFMWNLSKMEPTRTATGRHFRNARIELPSSASASGYNGLSERALIRARQHLSQAVSIVEV